MNNNVGRILYQSIFENKWVYIEYKNKNEELTKFWIAIIDIIPNEKKLLVNQFNINYSDNIRKNCIIYFESILYAHIVEGTICPRQSSLIQKLTDNEELFGFLFIPNNNYDILSYYILCNKYDSTPYQVNYNLVSKLDLDVLEQEKKLSLSASQFKEIVSILNVDKEVLNKVNKVLPELVINVISIEEKECLYLLAYKKLDLDIETKSLVYDSQILINYQFGYKNGREFVIENIRKYLSEEDSYLLKNIDKNKEEIISLIGTKKRKVTDKPFIVQLERNILIDLASQYQAIHEMYANNTVTEPIKAFFGEITNKSQKRKNFPVIAIDNKINLAQLSVIHNAMKYPITYVQGPPGTGKTNTIVNTIISGFFNKKTILLSSHNNHPMDEVYKKIRNIRYKGEVIPFPIIRLGNQEKIVEALEDIKNLYWTTKDIIIYKDYLDRTEINKEETTKEVSKLLENYERRIDLEERIEAIEKIIEENKNNYSLSLALQADRSNMINQLKEVPVISDQQIAETIKDDAYFITYLNYRSAEYIQKLMQPRYSELLEIILEEDLRESCKKFIDYLKKSDNLEAFIKIFPMIITTNMSVINLGEPKPYFDLIVLDEASQCDSAKSLLPIIKGERLLLVGDPQQLNPVIMLDENINEELMKHYNIGESYSYIKNSIYKSFVANDYISNEILLNHHYRCHNKIIEFNNKKFYNNKLIIKSDSKEAVPLEFIDISDSIADNRRNTSLTEANALISHLQKLKSQIPNDKTIGIITPFTNQSKLINQFMASNNINDVFCGTIHEFQGDEKDVIYLASGLSNSTSSKTYNWLKSNKELINVATSRARDKLVIISSNHEINRLHIPKDLEDNFYQLCQYVQNSDISKVTSVNPSSRALGIKPYGTKTEMEFFESLKHILDICNETWTIEKEVQISSLFEKLPGDQGLFYTGRFDFVLYDSRLKIQLVIELDGKEHKNHSIAARDRQKDRICANHGIDIIRVPNTYARRYYYIKNILQDFFKQKSMNPL